MGLTIQHAKNITVADMTGTATVFNSSGGSATVAASNIMLPSDWNSVHNKTFQVDETDMYNVCFFEPFVPANTNSTASTAGAGTWWLDPLALPAQLNSGQINLRMIAAAGFVHGQVLSAITTGSNTRYGTENTVLALYAPGSGASTSRLESKWSQRVSILHTWERRVGTTTSNQISWSNYLTISLPTQYDGSGGMTYSTRTTSGTGSVGASTGASTVMDSLISAVGQYVTGSLVVPVPLASKIPAGDYYLAVMTSSSTSNTGTNYTAATQFGAHSLLGMLEFVDRAYKRIGVSASNASSCMLPFAGSVATTSSAPISTLATSDMRNLATPRRLVWNYKQTSY